MNDDSSLTISQIKKRLSQVEAKLLCQKNLDRKRDTNEKKSLGKIFLLSGINSIIETGEITFRDTVIIGGLAKRLSLDMFKVSQYLGACIVTVNQCRSDKIYLTECVKYGANFYTEEHNKLSSPFDLIMGILIAAQEYLQDINNQTKAHMIGDVVFEEFKQKRAAERLAKVKNQYRS